MPILRAAALLLVGTLLAPARGGKGSDASIEELVKTVQKQEKLIKSLEKKVKRATGSCEADDADDPEPELRPFRVAELQKQARKKQEELLTLFSVTVGEPLTAVAVSSGLLDKQVPKLVVAGGASGALHLFDKNGTLALTLPPDAATSSAVTALIIGPKEDPFVAVGTRGGDVLLYNLTLPRAAIGKRPASGTTSLTLAMRAEAELDDSGAPAAVLALDTYMRGRKVMLAVGDATGALRILHRNGTQRAAVAAGGAVHAMERGGSNNAHLAVGAAGIGVALFDMGKPHNAPMICEGSEPPAANDAALVVATGARAGKGKAVAPPPPPPHVVSLTWDVQLPQLLYAASSDGVVAVYNSKQRSREMTGEFKNISKMVTGCKLVTTITGYDAAPLSLTPVKGYLFSASASLLTSHNVSGLYARTRDEPNVRLGRPLAGAPFSIAGTRAGYVVVGAGPLGELSMLHSKQPFKTAEEEASALGGAFGGSSSSGGAMNLMRNPMLLGVVMVLIFWQSSKFFNKGGDAGPSFAGRSALEGRGGMGDFDMDAFARMQGSHKKGGSSPAFDEAFAETFARGHKDFSQELGGGARGRVEELTQLS